MDSALMLGARFGLLILLWLFIFVVLAVQRRDIRSAEVAQRRTASVAPAPASTRREKAQEVVVVEGPLRGSHMNISTVEDLSLGRADDNDFVLGDDFASSRHARLFRRGSDWFVEDLDSRNGTFVGGIRIDQPERVQVGTDIKMGRTIVRLMP
ncbi:MULTISPECIES: FHA domain-containing protein FhaB/FipA [unclassified Corynebacterium]|uniref:FHA domain-containing protein FhaB/FipA n=1 Tax=unclassified Corynebacterium TaxID=2624378 RepID=UPI001B3376D4|nr:MULTISPECIES: FHA domain-containing protein [unclassified Corynebacterium]MBP3948381.1 FHA domain-containing protein [Corynebacterium sp. Marseille-P3884]MCT1451021.1 FHA domain-containing protein [Corynebacterium sp. p3-SID1194]